VGPSLPQVLCTVGDLVEDVVVLLSGPPATATDTPCTVLRARGGSAANVAVAAARAGADARFVGRVGDDDLGERLLARLGAASVDARVERGGRTGSIVVLVTPDGERTMLTDRGAAAELSSPDPAWLDGARALHVPAYSLGDGPIARSAAALWRHLDGAGAVRSLDASSSALLAGRGRGWWLGQVAGLAPDVLFANAGEAAYLGIGDQPPAGAGVAVVKDGPRPARVLRHDRAPVEVPALEVGRVVDTTGAGDAFAAGWLVATLGRADPVEATVSAHRLAAGVVATAGALA
jgi:sugar/nucleoside kinase (ribokinase family)